MPKPALAQRLRDETRDEHERIEAAMRWEERVASLTGYEALLARLHGFHLSFESAADAIIADEALLAPRRKAHLIGQDLQRLGWTPERIAALPRWRHDLAGRADAFGAMYVHEGAHLGGQIIARHVAATLGLTPERGLAFYSGYGPRTGAMWREFQERLEAEFPGERGDAVVAGARRAYAAMQDWIVPERAAA